MSPMASWPSSEIYTEINGTCWSHLMYETKLILVEGLPGAGKSTTAGNLRDMLNAHGFASRCFLEEDNPHPIPILDLEIKGLPEKVIPMWENLVNSAIHSDEITIIESRIWQNTCLYMLLSEIDPARIVEFAHKEEEVLSPLSPILIYLSQGDTQAALERLYPMRGASWVQSNLDEMSSYPWFQNRGISDFTGWVTFFEEWRKLSDQLFMDWNHPKLNLKDSHSNWSKNLRQIKKFLHLE